MNFYVTHEGAHKGPYTQAQISHLLNENKLLWNDFLFDENTLEWGRIMEHPLFTAEFNQNLSNPIKSNHLPEISDRDQLKKRKWFVLKENTNYGPFSKLELIQMLQGKTIFEQDFLWREGFDHWKKISEVPEFSTQQIREVHSLVGTSSEKDLKKVFFRRKFIRAQLETRIIIHDQKRVYTSKSVEISEGGVSFHLPQVTFPLGQQLYLHFGGGGELPHFNVISQVVSQRESLYGVQFTHISGVTKCFISKYAEEFKQIA